MSLSIFKYFGRIIQKTFFTYLHCINGTSNTLNYYIPDQGRIETLVTRLTCCACPPPPMLLPKVLWKSGSEGCLSQKI